MIEKKVVVFGAGATGRGHVGLLAWQAGYQLVFIDRNPELVKSLNRSSSYQVRLYSGRPGTQAYQDVIVDGYKVYPHEARLAIAREIVTASLVLTSVFDQNLQDVADTLALAVKECKLAKRSEPLNVIACENMMDSSSTLGKFVMRQLSEEDRAYAATHIGFPDCMISRVVPIPAADSLKIVTEDYNEWTVRREAFLGEKPCGLDALELVDNQTARLERKLFIHNGGHAVCGYMGYHRGWKYIHEAVADPTVLAAVLGVLDELGEVIRVRHGFQSDDIDRYKADLGRRGSIAELRDDVLRVVRDPIRKISRNERLVAPALLAGEYGLPRRWIVQGIVAALRYEHPSDEQSMRLAGMIRGNGLSQTVEQCCGISSHSDLHREIMTGWEEWDNR